MGKQELIFYCPVDTYQLGTVILFNNTKYICTQVETNYYTEMYKFIPLLDYIFYHTITNVGTEISEIKNYISRLFEKYLI